MTANGCVKKLFNCSLIEASKIIRIWSIQKQDCRKTFAHACASVIPVQVHDLRIFLLIYGELKMNIFRCFYFFVIFPRLTDISSLNPHDISAQHFGFYQSTRRAFHFRVSTTTLLIMCAVFH